MVVTEGVVLAEISREPLDVATALASVSDSRCGAVDLFIGQVRDHDPDSLDAAAHGPIVALEYTCHPDADDVIKQVVRESVAALAVPLARVYVQHHVGRLDVGGLALLVAAATPHRAEAFELCRAVVEAVKHRVPVWKQQFHADGSYTWPGCCAVAEPSPVGPQ